MNELKEIKQRILNENKITQLLEAMGCTNIKEKQLRCEAQLPDKFNSDNPRSVQVYFNENLSSKIRSRGISGIDIFGLVGYIVFECKDETECTNKLFASKKWICETLGYHEYLNGHYKKTKKDELLKWLKEAKKYRRKQITYTDENEIIDESILDYFVMVPSRLYLEQGVSYKTQLEFQIGLDVQYNRVIFPIHNECGELINIKGRTLEKDWEKKNIPKFYYYFKYYPTILYNWHRALYYILQEKEVIIYEGEKTCWLSSQWGKRNCVALGCSDISIVQVNLIKSLGNEIRIVLAFDKDKTREDIRVQAAKFGKTRLVYEMYDEDGVFSVEEKHSPTDLGREAFMGLYRNRKKVKF
jgi:DNA primase